MLCLTLTYSLLHQNSDALRHSPPRVLRAPRRRRPGLRVSVRGPLVRTANYTSFSNGALGDKPTCKGKAFNTITQVRFENTDLAARLHLPLVPYPIADDDGLYSTLRVLAITEPGILLTNDNNFTHPSDLNCETVPCHPKYTANLRRGRGDFFWMHNYNMYHIPSNISTVFDLLEDKLHLPGPVLRSQARPAHHEVISQDPNRVRRIRMFNDFANDFVNENFPQWAKGAHDTDFDVAASFYVYWLLLLLTDRRANDGKKLILLTFGKAETCHSKYGVCAASRRHAGGAVPFKMRGTTDDALYSLLSTVQVNWGRKSLGRQHTVAADSNVFSFFATKAAYKTFLFPSSLRPFVLHGIPHSLLFSLLCLPRSILCRVANACSQPSPTSSPSARRWRRPGARASGRQQGPQARIVPAAHRPALVDQYDAVADEPKDDGRGGIIPCAD
ncbi:hypothetical protein B0H14DRAFT_2617841 [Mycena olivaceomarginata]|nr:hypothetical protein B0H14DRAFT_2617841 [Mycena olivaceomarginata]